MSRFTDTTFGQAIPGLPAPEPCPFCGSAEHVHIDREEAPDAVIFVAGCGGCNTQAPAGDSWADAAAMWNCRSAADYRALVKASHDRMWEPNVEAYEAARA